MFSSVRGVFLGKCSQNVGELPSVEDKITLWGGIHHFYWAIITVGSPLQSRPEDFKKKVSQIGFEATYNPLNGGIFLY